MNFPTDEEKDWSGRMVDDYELYGWNADPALPFDDNVMDLVLLVTRSSICIQGHMACILVRPQVERDNEADMGSKIRDSIVSVATNRPLYKERHSDVHAEICALGAASQAGIKTEGCTAYITMPPCKTCFGALVAAGVKRVVSRIEFMEPVFSGAENMGIELVKLGRISEQKARINTLIYGDPNGKRRYHQPSDGSETKRLE